LGIETRPVFYPIHVLPPYQADELSFPVAERVGRSGISLPTWFGLTRDDVRYVTENFVNVLSRVRQTI
ncbi:MAG TPA: DegT/DnrJ/EryC1/StrS family aminotransferase, partial [Pyrinomonadaceae bacterium]|nr:DegT/DnrJ/EryC1/StrS family aminotransferase [Pyrinomonadaceae bacterium]